MHPSSLMKEANLFGLECSLGCMLELCTQLSDCFLICPQFILARRVWLRMLVLGNLDST